MDVVYDNLLDLISLQLNEGTMPGAAHFVSVCWLLNRCHGKTRRGLSLLGHALALGGDFAGHMRHTPTACSTCRTGRRVDQSRSSQQSTRQYGIRWPKILLRHRRLADDTDLADLVQAWLQRYDGESAEEKSAQLDLLLL